MRRGQLVLALVLLVIVAGCAGLSGGDEGSGTNATVDGQPPSHGQSGDQQSDPLDGPHPHVERGTLSFSSLGREHLESLRTLGSFELTDSIRVTNAANGSILTRATTEKRFDLVGERVIVERRRGTADGALVQGLYQNSTMQCSYRSGSTQCRPSEFSADRALGRVVEITSLETAGAPAFSPNGTTTVDGDPVYRFSATSLREDPPEQSLSELDGERPAIESATMLVAPEGYIVRYELRYTAHTDSGQVRIERRYRVAPTTDAAVSPPGWLSS